MALLLPFIPLLVRSLGVENDADVQRWSGAVFSAPFLTAAIMTPVWGWIGDLIGRKPMVVRALVGLSISILLMSFARTPLQLLLCRILQGAISGFIPAAIALVSAAAPKEKQGYALGVLTSAQAAGVVVGPLVGGVLADLLGYQPLFYITATTELASAFMVLIWVHEVKSGAQKRSTPKLLDNLQQALTFPIPVVLSALALTQLALFLVQPFLALYIESFGVGQNSLSTVTGSFFAITGLAMLLSAPLSGRLSDRFGRRRVLITAFLAAGAVFSLQGLAQNLPTLFVLRTLQGVFAAGMLPGLYAIVAHYTPEQQRGGIMAFGSSATLLGGLLGPLLGGIAASHFGMRPVFLGSSLLFFLNGLNALRLPPDRLPRPVRARRSWEL